MWSRRPSNVVPLLVMLMCGKVEKSVSTFVTVGAEFVHMKGDSVESFMWDGVPSRVKGFFEQEDHRAWFCLTLPRYTCYCNWW